MAVLATLYGEVLSAVDNLGKRGALLKATLGHLLELIKAQLEIRGQIVGVR